MRTMLLILGKDLRQRVKDRSVFMMALVVPFGLAAVFTLVFNGVGVQRIASFALVDADHGPIATTFTEQALRPLVRNGVIGLREAPSEQEARALVDRGEVAAAFVIPPGFSQAVQSARPATLRVIGSVDAQLGSYVARSIAQSFAGQVRYAQVALATRQGGDARAALAVPQPAEVVDAAPVAARQLTLAEGFAAGMAIFFLFFTVQFGFSGILDERREGTLARLLAAPVSRYTIVFGKLLSGAVVGVVSTSVLMAAMSLLLGARWGDPVGVAALVVAGVLAASGVMALVATLARTSEQAGNISSVFAVVLGVLGGVFLPVSQTGDAFATLSLITPHRWFLQGLADLGGGGGLGVIVTPVLALLAFAAVTMGIALLRVGRMLQP